MTKILICAASSAEAKACVKGVRGAGKSLEIEVLLTGMGLKNAAAGLRRRLAIGARPDLIVSSGLAGAFSPSLKKGDWVTSSEVYLCEDERIITAFAARSFCGAVPGVIDCSFASSSDLVVDHEKLERRYKGLSGQIAVDMESAALANVASEAGVGFAVFRLISDTPHEPLPRFLSGVAAALSAERPAERFQSGLKALALALADPRGVARLAKEMPRWSHALSDGWRQASPKIIEFASRS